MFLRLMCAAFILVGSFAFANENLESFRTEVIGGCVAHGEKPSYPSAQEVDAKLIQVVQRFEKQNEVICVRWTNSVYSNRLAANFDYVCGVTGVTATFLCEK